MRESGYSRKSVGVLVWLVLLCALRMGAQQPATLFLHSTIDALLAGACEGDLSVAELKQKGDFAIGTYDRLDGEMIAVDGDWYQAKADGRLYPAGPEMTTPLAMTVHFQPESTAQIPRGMTLNELEQWLDGRIGNPNLFYALRVEGSFAAVTVRAVERQKKPYRAMKEVVAGQSVHRLERVRGTLIALRSPAFSKGISVVGYHWHFVTAERKQGGHVLDLMLTEGMVQLQSIARVQLDLPRTEGFAHADQTQDRSAETRLVERR